MSRRDCPLVAAYRDRKAAAPSKAFIILLAVLVFGWLMWPDAPPPPKTLSEVREAVEREEYHRRTAKPGKGIGLDWQNL